MKDLVGHIRFRTYVRTHTQTDIRTRATLLYLPKLYVRNNTVPQGLTCQCSVCEASVLPEYTTDHLAFLRDVLATAHDDVTCPRATKRHWLH